MNDERRARLSHFFNVFRHRSKAIEQIQATFGARMLPERFVLVSAGLDALAMYWGKLYRPDIKSGGERMGEFLVAHASRDIFSRVAAPLLIQRARKDRAPSLRLLESVLKVDYDDKSVREWMNDPTLQDVLVDQEIASSQLDRDWIRWGRYGEVLYREIRNSWIHESGEPRDLPPADYKVFDDLDHPHYTNQSRVVETGKASPRYTTEDRKLITFPFAFLLNTFKGAIESFETRCLAEDKLPDRA